MVPGPDVPISVLDIPENKVPLALVTGDKQQSLMSISDNVVPLAGGLGTAPPLDRKHVCCIIHFLLMILLLGATLVYTRSQKKRQERIFAIRRELAELGLFPGLEGEARLQEDDLVGLSDVN